MNYTFKDEEAGTTTTHQVDLRRDGNKIADSEGNSWLHCVARSGSETAVSGFIQLGGGELKLNEMNREGLTPLMLAVKAGRQKIVEILLDAGADIEVIQPSKNWSALAYAVFSNTLSEDKNSVSPIVQLLLDRGAVAGENDEILKLVAASGNIALMEAVVKAGANPFIIANDGGSLALYYSTEWCHVPLTDYLLNEYQVDPKRRIHFVKREQSIDTFLAKGIDIDELDHEGHTPLFVHCKRGFHFMIQKVLERGANPNLKQPALKESGDVTTEISPFQLFAASLPRNREDERCVKTYHLIQPKDLLELTQLFLNKGGVIDSGIKGDYNKYLKRYDSIELKNLINAHYKSDCVIS